MDLLRSGYWTFFKSLEAIEPSIIFKKKTNHRYLYIYINTHARARAYISYIHIYILYVCNDICKLKKIKPKIMNNFFKHDKIIACIYNVEELYI